MKKPKTIKDIVQMNPMEFANFLATEYLKEDIPLCCASIDDLALVGDLLIFTINTYSYLVSVANSIKIQIRMAKREGNKALAEDLIDKNFCLQNCIEVISKREKTLSRLVTIKQMENEEIRMAGKL